MEAKLQSLQLTGFISRLFWFGFFVFAWGVYANRDARICGHFVMFLCIFLVYFRRCGRVRKKHHCEADEDSTRQRLQRRVSAAQYAC